MFWNTDISSKRYQKYFALTAIVGFSVLGISCNRDHQSISIDKFSFDVYKGNLIDDSPPGSYDFTIINPNKNNQYVSVPSPCSGQINYVGHDTGGYGNYLKLSCGIESWLMAHFESISVSQGESVRKGDIIAIQGSTGNSTGPHIHAEILSSNGKRIENRDLTRDTVMNYINYLE